MSVPAPDLRQGQCPSLTPGVTARALNLSATRYRQTLALFKPQNLSDNLTVFLTDLESFFQQFLVFVVLEQMVILSAEQH